MSKTSAECGVRSAEWQATSIRSRKSLPAQHSEGRAGAIRNFRHARLTEEAHRYLVGGVNSPVRAFRAVGQPPLFLRQGQGALVMDARGRRLIDLIMGWGALIVGHAHPAVLRAIRAQLKRGTLLGLTHEAEVELAKTISKAVPSIEQLRCVASGTEACMTAIRLARATTGRPKVLTFEGCYHGHSDGLLGLSKSAGVPASCAQDTVVVPYNDQEAMEEAIRRYGDQLACAIIEPVAANMGVIVPHQDYLRRLRAMTKQADMLLIFDEVVTGFRLAWGGAQSLFGVTPDLTVLGKIIGGGFPIGAVGGPRQLMQQLAPEGPVYHAGTFAGHPMAMVAGLATLHTLTRGAVYSRLESLGARLAEGLREAALRSGVPVQVNRAGSMLTVFFSQAPIRQFTESQQADRKRFADVANAFREAGVLVPPSPFEAMFVSLAHTPAMLDRVLDAFADACRSVRG